MAMSPSAYPIVGVPCSGMLLTNPNPSVSPPPRLHASEDAKLCLKNSICCGTFVDLPRSLVCRGLLSLLASFFPQDEASAIENAPLAFSLGFSGPKEWLKGQKKKTSEYLLAPIIASRERLKTAISLARTNTANNMLEAQSLVKVAARDCIKPEDGSIVAFQVKTGVEVCTFRLILKNAASLLDDTDPIKLNANAALDNLIRFLLFVDLCFKWSLRHLCNSVPFNSSFTMLDNTLSSGNSSSDDNLPNAFNQTNIALNNFETQIRKCLGIS